MENYCTPFLLYTKVVETGILGNAYPLTSFNPFPSEKAAYPSPGLCGDRLYLYSYEDKVRYSFGNLNVQHARIRLLSPERILSPSRR